MSDLILYFWLANPFSHFMENKKVVVTNLFLLFTKSSVSASGAGFAPAALLQHQKTNRPNKDQQTNICAVRIHAYTQMDNTQTNTCKHTYIDSFLHLSVTDPSNQTISKSSLLLRNRQVDRHRDGPPVLQLQHVHEYYIHT